MLQQPKTPVAHSILQKLLELGWEAPLHPLYSPDFSPSDYHLWLSLGKAQRYITLFIEGNLNQLLEDIFASQTKAFYHYVFQNLPKNGMKISVVPVNTSI